MAGVVTKLGSSFATDTVEVVRQQQNPLPLEGDVEVDDNEEDGGGEADIVEIICPLLAGFFRVGETVSRVGRASSTFFVGDNTVDDDCCP